MILFNFSYSNKVLPFGIRRFNKINTLMNIFLLLIRGDEKYSGLSIDILV